MKFVQIQTSSYMDGDLHCEVIVALDDNGGVWRLADGGRGFNAWEKIELPEACYRKVEIK